MVSEIGYGRLDFILAIMLPCKTPPVDGEDKSDVDEDDQGEHTYVLAHITEAKGVHKDAALELVRYRESGQSFILDVQNIEHVVGRVFTRGVVPGGEWAIIDCSQGVAQTDFHVDEHSSEDEAN